VAGAGDYQPAGTSDQALGVAGAMGATGTVPQALLERWRGEVFR